VAGAPDGIRVDGAWLGAWLGAWVGVLAGLVAEVVWCVAGGEALALWLAPAVGSPEWLAEADAEDFAVGVCTPVAIIDGDISGAVEPGELVHAHTVTETRAVKIAQLTAAGLALDAVPWLIMRTFMTPPYLPGRQS